MIEEKDEKIQMLTEALTSMSAKKQREADTKEIEMSDKYDDLRNECSRLEQEVSNLHL